MKRLNVAGCIFVFALSTAMQAAPNSSFVDVGPEPQEPVAATRRLMSDLLRDPDSAQYRYLGSHPAHCKKGWASGGKDWFGYAVSLEINSRNALGGYVGFQRYTILFNGDVAWKAIEGANFGAFGPSRGLLGLGGGAGVCKYLD